MKMIPTQYDVLKHYVIRYLNEVDYPANIPYQSDSDRNWQLYRGTLDQFDLHWLDDLVIMYMTRNEVIDSMQRIIYDHTKDLVVPQPSTAIDIKITIETPPAVGKTTIAYTIQRALQQMGINSVHVHDDNGVGIVEQTPQQVREHIDEKIKSIVSKQPIVEICTKQLRTKPPANPYGY